MADAFIMESQRAPRRAERCVHAAVLHSVAPAAIRRGADAELPCATDARVTGSVRVERAAAPGRTLCRVAGPLRRGRYCLELDRGPARGKRRSESASAPRWARM